MSDRFKPELIIFELGGFARSGEAGLCTEEITCVLDEAAELGVRRVILEVTAPQRADELTRLASSASMRMPQVTVAFNRGFAPDARIAAEFSEAGVSDVAIPIDIFDGGAPVPRELIETIRDEGLGVRAVVAGWPGLIDVAGIARRLASAGVTRLQIDVICDTTRCPITASMVERLAREIVDVARRGTIAMIVTELPLVKRIDVEASRAAATHARGVPRAPIELDDSRTTMRIGRMGEVVPSRALPLVAGNVRRQRLAGIWSVSKLYPGLRDRERLLGQCGYCGWRDLCGGSRARAWHAEGDYNAADPACALPVTTTLGATRLATARTAEGESSRRR